MKTADKAFPSKGLQRRLVYYSLHISSKCASQVTIVIIKENLHFGKIVGDLQRRYHTHLKSP